MPDNEPITSDKIKKLLEDNRDFIGLSAVDMNVYFPLMNTFKEKFPKEWKTLRKLKKTVASERKIMEGFYHGSVAESNEFFKSIFSNADKQEYLTENFTDIEKALAEIHKFILQTKVILPPAINVNQSDIKNKITRAEAKLKTIDEAIKPINEKIEDIIFNINKMLPDENQESSFQEVLTICEKLKSNLNDIPQINKTSQQKELSTLLASNLPNDIDFKELTKVTDFMNLNITSIEQLNNTRKLLEFKQDQSDKPTNRQLFLNRVTTPIAMFFKKNFGIGNGTGMYHSSIKYYALTTKLVTHDSAKTFIDSMYSNLKKLTELRFKRASYMDERTLITQEIESLKEEQKASTSQQPSPSNTEVEKQKEIKVDEEATNFKKSM